MNTAPQEIFHREEKEKNEAPGSWQDKVSASRLSAASTQPATPHKPALKKTKTIQSQKGTKVFAGTYIDRNTDLYIHTRQMQSRNPDGTHWSRTKTIRVILEERAADDSFQATRSVLMPMIRETMREERHYFDNRYIALNARIAYQVGFILVLLLKFMGIIFRKDIKTFEQIEADSETAARVNVTTRTKQLEEVIGKIRQEMEGKP
jgi:hypothetical protein